MPQDYYLKLIDTLDKPFDLGVFDKLIILYDNIGDFATLLLDRTKLNLERRKMTDSMLRDITRAFYEMVFKNSPAWQSAGKEFEKDILAFIKGEKKIITLPPSVDPERSEIYLHVGERVVQSFFKGEKRLMEAFVDKAFKMVAELAIRLRFRIVAFDTELLDKILCGYGVTVNFGFYSNGFVTIGYEASDDEQELNDSDDWIVELIEKQLEEKLREKRGEDND